MQLFRRGKKPSEDADHSNNGSAPSPKPAINDHGDAEKNEISLARTKTEDIVYPTGIKLGLLMTSVFISSKYLSVGRWSPFGLTAANECEQCSWWHSYVMTTLCSHAKIK